MDAEKSGWCIVFIDGSQIMPANIRVHVYRGYYMSAHALLNLLNELRKRDKMRGLSCISSLFHSEFNKFNDTGARMLD